MFWSEYLDYTYAYNINMQIDSISPEIQEITKIINKFIFGANQISRHPRDLFLILSVLNSSFIMPVKNTPCNFI